MAPPRTKPRERFWTAKRLDELRRLSRESTPEELAIVFGRTTSDIIRAQHYERNKRRLRLETVWEVHQGRKVLVTRFKPEIPVDPRNCGFNAPLF